MNPTTTKGAAAGSYGGGSLVIVIVVWLLHQYAGVDVPGDVSAAAAALIGMVTHAAVAIAAKRGIDLDPTDDSPPASSTPATPAPSGAAPAAAGPQ